MKVAVIDYGVGNLGSVIRAFKELRSDPILVNRPVDLHSADCLVLPGVGNFSECMELLDKNGWTVAIREEALGFGKPFLGICLGMQLLAEWGEEGTNSPQGTRGLGLVSGRVRSLRSLGCKSMVPHMGWNSIRILSKSALFEGIPSGTDFYFVHSFGFEPIDKATVLATTVHDIEVVVAVESKNVCGTQFHPEKSSKAGFKVLRNFLENFKC